MKLLLLVLSIFVLISCAGVTLSDSSQVTGQQIQIYKYGVERGCKDNGISKGEPKNKVEAFCRCVLDTLNKNISYSEWQKAYYFSVKHQGSEEMKIMASHFKETEACRTLP